jgi:hypothetical protein
VPSRFLPDDVIFTDAELIEADATVKPSGPHYALEGAQAEAVKNLLGADCNRIATVEDAANKKAR